MGEIPARISEEIMNETVKVLFGLIGGLAMFLFGMNAMSEALQKAAGERMKKILQFLTKNPLMGALAGALVTAVLQSSSATTVMTIGFVSAGLMSLPQAISVVFGANIGTTMTAQLIAFKISDYIYPIIFVGFLLNFAAKKERTRSIGMVIFSFGLLFEGIEIMSSVMKPLAGSAFFLDLMSRVQHIPVLGVLLGLMMTLVVQSSSATIAVLQSFASQPGPDGVSSVIGLIGAIPILLGDNIGTTITALLASIGQSSDAKRTAIAHSIFNISGSILFLFLLHPFAAFVRMISPKGPEVEVISRQIANAHTTFNVAMTLIWLPLIGLMVKIVLRVIPDKKTAPAQVTGAAGVQGGALPESGKVRPEFLDDNLISQPVAAMMLVSREIRGVASRLNALLDLSRAELRDGGASEPAFRRAAAAIRDLQQQITRYITVMFEKGILTEEQADQTSSLMYVSDNIGRIADRYTDVSDSLAGMKNRGLSLSKEAAEELVSCVDISGQLFARAMQAVESGDEQAAAKVSADRRKMHRAEKKFRKAHLERVKKKQCSPLLTEDFNEILSALDRTVDNSVAIAEEAQDHLCMDDIENVLEA